MYLLLAGVATALTNHSNLKRGPNSAATIDLTLRVSSYESDKRVPVALKWTPVPGALFYRIFKRKPRGEWQSISSFNYADGEPVSVLNAYPTRCASGIWCYDMPSADYQWADGSRAQLEASASLKVWMEGGTKNGVTFENVGWNPVRNEQAIKVDVIGVQSLNAAPWKIWDYDIFVLGTWDGAGTDWDTRTYNFPNAALRNELEKYIRAGYGVVASHDSMSVVSGTGQGLGPLRDYFGVKIGQKIENLELPCDFRQSWEIWTTEVQVVKEGFLTKFPFDIDRRRLTVPLTHTYGNMVFGEVWMEMIEIGFDWSRPDQIREAWKLGGNPICYLTTKGNTAMLQTGHNRCESTLDERKVWANALFYLKQRTDKAERIDNSGFDFIGPSAPLCRMEAETYDQASYVCSSTDVSELYEYEVQAYTREDPYNAVATSDVKSIDIASGVSRFLFVVDRNPDTTVSSATGAIASSDGSADIKKASYMTYVHVAALDGVGNIGATTTYTLDAISPSPTFSDSIRIEPRESLQGPWWICMPVINHIFD